MRNLILSFCLAIAGCHPSGPTPSPCAAACDNGVTVKAPNAIKTPAKAPCAEWLCAEGASSARLSCMAGAKDAQTWEACR